MSTMLMGKAAAYKLLKLPYAYNALEPFMSEQLLTLHHTGYYQAYVSGATDINNRLGGIRTLGSEPEVQNAMDALSLNIGGIVLHDFFWLSLAPAARTGKPSGRFEAAINSEFSSVEIFKKEFTKAAAGIKGRGWAVLAIDSLNKKPAILRIEQNHLNVYPAFPAIMALDTWEHAYYLDYKNDFAGYMSAVWNIINWAWISRRWDDMMKWLTGGNS